jgi:molybdopterin-guanine dinucleotide biosynthesis protein A
MTKAANTVEKHRCRTTLMREQTVAGLVLAGGRSSRMGGGDKCLMTVGNKSMLQHAVERLTPQVHALAVSANGEATRFEKFALPVLEDVVPGFAGPLAGVLSGMLWARTRFSEVTWLTTVAADTPFYPRSLVADLLAAATSSNAAVAFAASGGRAHPVFALWRVALADALQQALLQDNERKIDRFAARYRVAEVAFASKPFDPFFNVNRPEDLVEATTLLELVDKSSQAQ